jgi:hypothetical protein
MQLIDELERLARDASMFQAQLLREDVSRLRRLEELSRTAGDKADFIKSGMRLGWTQGDARTEELREPLVAFLEAVYDLQHGGGEETGIARAWHALHRTRMERLLGCLSAPLPRPAD